jgi:hypothetical protein
VGLLYRKVQRNISEPGKVEETKEKLRNTKFCGEKSYRRSLEERGSRWEYNIETKFKEIRKDYTN